MKQLTVTLFMIVLVGTAAAQKGGKEQDVENDYDKNAVRAAPRDAFPVLNDPKMVSANEAKDIKEEEPVIGIEINGEAKAYPISIMGLHELANDTCGGTPIAVSW